MDQPVTFGEWLRRRRDDLRFTRKELSERVGCSVSALRKFEADERRPSIQIADLIARSLEVPPEVRATFVQVARGELAVDRLPPAPKQGPHPGHPPGQARSEPGTNLPVFPTPLVGRQRELDELTRLLRNPQVRLLTLVGPGGIGKTRLAVEAAAHTQDAFADGVCFGPFVHVRSPRLIIPVIAQSTAFSFQTNSSADPRNQLLDYLDNKQILLVVDNLEHLLGDPTVTEFFAELLRRAARTKVLVTSRESLGLHGEWVFEVPGLPIPEGEGTDGTSVELFLQRARRANVRFSPTTDDSPAIVRICRLVGGMPLGVELAAAWVRALPCHEIAREIERGLDILSVSARDLPARHRSIRAVIDHSWSLLSEEEQGVLLRLSVFQGGFQREAAEAVIGASLSTLSALVTKSLVRRSTVGRYDLHELIHQFAQERLSALPQTQAQARAAHGAYCMAFLTDHEEDLRSSAQQQALTELTGEIANIRRALEWALDDREFARVERALPAYAGLFDTMGWAPEALDYLGRVQEALETPRQDTAPGRAEQIALAHTLTVRSLFAFRVGQHEHAAAMLTHSLEILRPIDEPRVLVEALTFLGIVSLLMGDLPGALELFHEGRQTALAIGDLWFAALCFTEQVSVDVMMGRSEGALERFQAAVESWRATGDPRFTAFGLNFLSWSAIAAGRYEEAQRALEESVSLYCSVGDRWGLASAYRGLALVAQAQDDHPQAIVSFERSLGIFTDLGARWDAARVHSDLGRSLLAVGDESGAERVWREALRVANETKGTPVELDALAGMAGLRAKRGHPDAALAWLLLVLNHPAVQPETKVRATDLVTGLEMSMTHDEIEAAHAVAGNSTYRLAIKGILRQDGGVWPAD